MRPSLPIFLEDPEAIQDFMLEVAAEPRPPAIEKAGNGWAALHRAAAAGKDAEVGRLIGSGVGPNVRDADGNAPLHAAASCGTQGTAQLLILAGADVDVRDDEDRTPLQQAARYGNAAVASLLVVAGAEVDARNNRGLAALHMASFSEAASKGSAEGEMVGLLIEAGANPQLMIWHPVLVSLDGRANPCRSGV